jgi:hypothetical protein
MDRGPAYFADPVRGADTSAGSREQPWKTIGHALGRLKPGDTLYLRGGTYYEAVAVSLAGTEAKPITLRSHPGEQAILDGGLREFFEKPAEAWEPDADGAKGEFRSTKAYPELAKGGKGRRDVSVIGNFGDSMVPLHGYRFRADFRSDNPYWNVTKVDGDKGVYLGPGLWLDADSKRIHVRLAHTTLKVLGDANYRGETDPRRLALVVAGDRVPLRVEKARHVRFQDLVVRGSSSHTVDVLNCDGVEFDNVTIHGGAPALYVRSTGNLRLLRCALRGLAAPWSSRSSQKYRGNSPYLFVAAGTLPQSHGWEIAYSEFTDNHDGLVLSSVRGLRFHHNRVDNFNDDGIYLTSLRAAPPRDVQIAQNHFSRCLTTFAFAVSSKKGATEVGPGVHIFRNVFDLRQKTSDGPPRDAAADAKTTLDDWSRHARLVGDHGSPTWEPMFFYHNTVITANPAFRNYYGAGLGGHTAKTRRRVFNNIFVQIDGNPGLAFGSASDDVQADGNLLWSPKAGPGAGGDYLAAFRRSKLFDASKKQYAPGWCAGDRFADPLFVSLADGAKLDVRLREGSPATDGGVEVPADWPDPLRKLDRGKPDVGAMPLGAGPLRVGPGAAPVRR